jgi:concanavalin A-like lectin/glucanase superfamily protein
VKRLLLLLALIVAFLVLFSAGYVLIEHTGNHTTATADASQPKTVARANLRFLSSATVIESATAVAASGYMKSSYTLSWAPFANATGYALFRDGKQVSTAGPLAVTTRFLLSSAGQHSLEVRAIFGSPPPTTTAPTTTTPPTTTTALPTTTASTVPLGSNYDTVVLGDKPVAYWAMNGIGTEQDISGNGHTGTYSNGPLPSATMPNGDFSVDFNGTSQYLTVPSSAAFSIPTTHELTWETWIRPDVLQFPKASTGYADWMGKCASYSPTCEWESRMYSTTNSENRCNRISAYVFNPGAGLGSAADWQPVCGIIQAGRWYHVVGEYQTLTTPSGCNSSYPGSINIWVNGIKQSFADHSPTGCMSQYSIRPVSNSSPLKIGTMAGDFWFAGAIAKAAIYDHLLTQSQITAHFTTMTGLQPSGSCGNTCTIP